MNQALNKETMQIFDAIAGILLRCFLITVISSLFVWAMVGLLGDLFYQINTFWFDITRKEYDTYVLYSLTFMKVLNVVFFLFPFLAIKHFLRNKTTVVTEE